MLDLKMCKGAIPLIYSITFYRKQAMLLIPSFCRFYAKEIILPLRVLSNLNYVLMEVRYKSPFPVYFVISFLIKS